MSGLWWHVKMEEGAEELIPVKAYQDDAAFDLFNIERVDIEPGEHVRLRTGVLESMLPQDYWGFIHGRSSTRQRYGLSVRSSVVDSGYRGEIFMGVDNVGRTICRLMGGERIGQIVFIQNTDVRIATVPSNWRFAESERGASGFGSSGR